MKNIIERIAGGGAKIAGYLPKAVSTRLAVAALAALAAGGTGAAVKPLAVWNGDFPTTNDGTDTRNGYKLSVKGNTASADGSKITLASSKQGVEILHYDANGVLAVASTPFAAVYNIYGIATGGSRMLGTSIVKNGSNVTYNRTMAGLNGTTFDSWYSGGAAGSENTAETFSGNASTMYSVCFLYHPSDSQGTDLYIDGSRVMQATTTKFGADQNNIYGVSLGGSSGSETRWNFPNAEISYVALLNSENESDISAWSLNNMTSAATFTNGGTISSATDYSATGINLNGGTVTVSGEITAAAIFVQADTTLNMVPGTDKLVSTGPVYIADGVTLTINTTANPGDYVAGTALSKDLITGTLYIAGSTVKAGTIADVSAGRAVISADSTNNKVSWTYTPMPVWRNGTWLNNIAPDNSTTEIAIDSIYSATFNAGGSYSSVHVIGTGTLAIGANGLTATTLDVASGAAINMANATATTITGGGTVIYDGTTPSSTIDSSWTGTVWVKNCSGTQLLPNSWGNASSVLRFTNVTGWLANGTVSAVPVELVNDGSNAALTLHYTTAPTTTLTFNEFRGNGTFATTADNGVWPSVAHKVLKWDAFTGSLNIDRGRFVFGTGTFSQWRCICVSANQSVEVASGATWTGSTGFFVDSGATLTATGTLAYGGLDGNAVSGSGTVVFKGKVPATGSDWWTTGGWAGTVQIDSLTGFVGTGSGTVLEPNKYGNSGSTLELKNCSGWLPVNYECSVPLSIAGTLTIGDGHSGVGNAFTIDHLKGSGQIKCNGSAPTVLIYVREWSGYAGKVKMDNKMIVFGADTITENDLVSGTIYICEGAVVTNRNAYHWEPAAKMKVNGTFAVTSRAGWTDSKPLELGANGVVNFIGSGVDDHNYNFSNITGSGKILFTSGTGYSMLPSDASKMPSTDVAVVNDNTASFVVLTCTGTTTIGTLSGSGKFDSCYETVKTRRLAVVQGADSEWSGTFVNEDRVGGMDVSAKSGAAAKTLTLSGTQTASNELVVQTATATTDAGSVNLTGTWQGDTTVSGTFGGTGTLTGNLTFNAGSTFKAFASDTDGLSVSGTITYPSEGTVTVDVSVLTETIGKVVLMTAENATLDATKFALASGRNGELLVEDNVLMVDLTTYAASYGGVKYETIQKAIEAAVEDGHTFADVKILDNTATCPAEYYIDTEDNDALKMYQAAIVQNNEGAMTTNFFKAAQLAVDALEGAPYTYSYYSHFEVYSGTAVEMTVNPSAGSGALWTAFRVKVKCLNGATVAVAIDSTEYELTVGTADENGIVTYTTTEKATTYVWAGATSGSASTSEKNYARADNWKVGTSSGATATRAPGSLDTVVFGNGVYASITASQIVAALQVSGAVTIIGDGSLTSASAITLGTGDSITITGTLSPVPATTVANSYVKATTSDSTTTYTVATQPTVSDVAFEYGDDFATATVTATVSDAAPSYKLTVGGTEYTGVVSGSTVTFENVATGRTAAYDDVSYAIAATSGSTAVPLAGDTSGSAVVADSAAWIAENETNTGKAAAGGAWATAVTYTEGAASIADNTFTAANPSTGDRVVLSFEDVVYPALSDLDGADLAGAQGAIAIGEVSGQTATTNFYVLVNEDGSAVWRATPVQAELDVPYDLELVFDYAKQKYSAKAGGTALSVGGDSGFALCTAGTKVSSLDFKGSGRLASINGSQQTGYMVKDSKGSYYATIAAAISAYASDKSIAPFEMLHAGAAPSGWKIVIENGIKLLVKAAKGFLMMAM